MGTEHKPISVGSAKSSSLLSAGVSGSLGVVFRVQLRVFTLRMTRDHLYVHRPHLGRFRSETTRV